MQTFNYLKDFLRQCDQDDFDVLEMSEDQFFNQNIDNDCLEILVENFSIEKQIIPHGAYGAGIIVRDNKDNQLLLKIKSYIEELEDEYDEYDEYDEHDEIEVSGSVSEIINSCKINELAKMCEVFTYMYGWIRCNSLPREWSKSLYSNYSTLTFMNPNYEGSIYLMRISKVS